MKRVRMNAKKPNPLFEHWLEDWVIKAASKKSPLQHYFSKALDSLRKYPLPLNSGKECLILEHFNSKLCSLLDKKIEEWQGNIRFHKETNGYTYNDALHPTTEISNISDKLDSERVSIKKKSTTDCDRQVKGVSLEPATYLASNQDKIIMQANSFDIILLVDLHEINRKKAVAQTDNTVALLTELGTLFEVRHLNIGDFAWIARSRHTNKEFILPYIAERKRLDDLSASIKDGRYRKQKFRLRQSGIQNLIYIVEKYDKAHLTCIPFSSLMQASVNVLLRDGFAVQHTNSHKATLLYLSHMTNTLTHIFKGKRLSQGKREELDLYDPSNSLVYLMTYEEFYRSTSKRINITVREMFVRHLIRLWGMSMKKAVAITERYPSPCSLIGAIDNGNEIEKGDILSNVPFGESGRKIGSAIGKNICKLYLKKELT